jgi:nucleoside-diphosphate kinase
MERTLAIIKPDAVADGDSGFIITLIERNKFTVSRMQKLQLTRKQAEQFYEVHKERPFYNELVDGMISGPVIVMALERDNAIAAWRELMGATDPQKAAFGTIRRMVGKNIGSNAVHGSDAPQTAQTEVRFFFSDLN